MNYSEKTIKNLLQIINTVNHNKGLPTFSKIIMEMDLRNDLGFDSLDLAELSVRIDDKFSVDVFEDGNINTVKDILDRLHNA